VFLAFDDANFGQRLFEYLNEQPDLQVCGKVEIGEEAVREAVELRPDIAILELATEDDLQVSNAFKQHIPSVPLLLVAEEVSLEAEEKALAHGVDAVFPKQDDPAAPALNVRALYDIRGGDREGET
jgi:DNA-binding NarL/FixJ family response regulator